MNIMLLVGLALSIIINIVQACEHAQNKRLMAKAAERIKRFMTLRWCIANRDFRAWGGMWPDETKRSVYPPSIAKLSSSHVMTLDDVLALEYGFNNGLNKAFLEQLRTLED